MGDFDKEQEADLPRGIDDKPGRLTEASLDNPAALVGPESTIGRNETGAIAAALIFGKENEPHWSERANILVAALVMQAAQGDILRGKRAGYRRRQTFFKRSKGFRHG